MNKYKVGIAGCGGISSTHTGSLARLDNVEIVAVCDVDEEKAKRKAEELGCAYYLDYREMVTNGGIDTLHICAPHYLHPPMAIYAVEHGVDVLSEKPMAIHYADALEMVRAAKINNRVLGVIFQNRYNAGSVLIKENLESGALGRILGAKMAVTWHRTDEYYSGSTWRGRWETEGGGVIINQAIHTVDLMNWFIGARVSSVDSHICNRAHGGIEVEDMAEGLITYENGVTASFYAINYHSCDAPVSIELHCENGSATIEGMRGAITFNDGRTFNSDDKPTVEAAGGKEARGYWGSSHVIQIRNFYEALAKGEQPDITGESVLNTQRLICAIYDSGKFNQKIIFDVEAGNGL